MDIMDPVGICIKFESPKIGNLMIPVEVGFERASKYTVTKS